MWPTASWLEWENIIIRSSLPKRETEDGILEVGGQSHKDDDGDASGQNSGKQQGVIRGTADDHSSTRANLKMAADLNNSWPFPPLDPKR